MEVFLHFSVPISIGQRPFLRAVLEQGEHNLPIALVFLLLGIGRMLALILLSLLLVAFLITVRSVGPMAAVCIVTSGLVGLLIKFRGLTDYSQRLSNLMVDAKNT